MSIPSFSSSRREKRDWNSASRSSCTLAEFALERRCRSQQPGLAKAHAQMGKLRPGHGGQAQSYTVISSNRLAHRAAPSLPSITCPHLHVQQHLLEGVDETLNLFVLHSQRGDDLPQSLLPSGKSAHTPASKPPSLAQLPHLELISPTSRDPGRCAATVPMRLGAQQRQVLGEALVLPSLTQQVGTMKIPILQAPRLRHRASLSVRNKLWAGAQRLQT